MIQLLGAPQVSKIVEMAREAGAKKVYFASAAPAIKYQNLYGIDMPATAELIASNKSNDEVASEINADWLIYQTLEGLNRFCEGG